MHDNWKKNFISGNWEKQIDVRDFLQANYTPYVGDDSFLAGPTEATTKLWEKVTELTNEENNKGILDVETKVPSSVTSHGPGYVDKSLEKKLLVFRLTNH